MTLAAAIPVLVVEDEPDLQEAMVDYLNLEGFAAAGVGSVTAAESWLATHQARVVVLDLGLPGEDGQAWLERTDALADKGVVIVSARGALDDRLSGLNAGADGYLVKPVDMAEMTALVRNLAHRLGGPVHPAWRLDELTWTLVSPTGETVKLTASELRVMAALAEQAGEPVARETLTYRLGEHPEHYDHRRMEILVRRLRNKAGEAFAEALPLATVRGYGYAFTDRIEITSSAE